jgi:hypothetical protein
MAVSALFAAILGNGACAKDSVSPGFVKMSNTATLVTETLVPYEDVSNPGGFGGTAGSLWASLDDATCNDDVDYVYRNRLGLPPTISQATVRLTTPVGTPSGGFVKVRWKVIGNYSTFTPYPTSLYYELFQGTTQKAVHTVYPNGSSYVTDSVSAGGVTGWNGLTIRLTMTLKPASSGDQIQGRVTCARFEVQ